MPTQPESNARKAMAAVITVVLAAMAVAALWLRAPDEAAVRPGPVAETPIERAPTHAVPTDEPVPEVIAVEEAPLDLDVRLVATVVRSDPSASFAALARRDGTDSTLVGVGEPIPFVEGALVESIDEGVAVVAVGDRRLRLTATSRLDPLAASFLEAVRTAPRREIDTEEKARRAAMVDRLRARMAAGEGSGTRVEGDGLFADGRARGHFEEGRLRAIEIDQIEPGGFYEAIGLEDGDRIVGINGVSIGDPDAAGRIIQELITADTIVADIENDSGDDSISIPSDEVLEELRTQFSELSAEELEAIESLSLDFPDTTNDADNE